MEKEKGGQLTGVPAQMSRHLKSEAICAHSIRLIARKRKKGRKRKRKVDSLPEFPRNAVQSDTETPLTSVFEMGTGNKRPYGRP